MAQLSNLIVTGVSRLLGKLYVNDTVTAPKFVGNLEGTSGIVVSNQDLTLTANEKKTISKDGMTEGVYVVDATYTTSSSGQRALGLVTAVKAGTQRHIVLDAYSNSAISMSVLSDSVIQVSAPFACTINIKITKIY